MCIYVLDFGFWVWSAAWGAQDLEVADLAILRGEDLGLWMCRMGEESPRGCLGSVFRAVWVMKVSGSASAVSRRRTTGLPIGSTVVPFGGYLAGS